MGWGWRRRGRWQSSGVRPPQAAAASAVQQIDLLDLLFGDLPFGQPECGAMGTGVELDGDGLISQGTGVVVGGITPDQQRLVGHRGAQTDYLGAP